MFSPLWQQRFNFCTSVFFCFDRIFTDNWQLRCCWQNWPSWTQEKQLLRRSHRGNKLENSLCHDFCKKNFLCSTNYQNTWELGRVMARCVACFYYHCLTYQWWWQKFPTCSNVLLSCVFSNRFFFCIMSSYITFWGFCLLFSTKSKGESLGERVCSREPKLSLTRAGLQGWPSNPVKNKSWKPHLVDGRWSKDFTNHCIFLWFLCDFFLT